MKYFKFFCIANAPHKNTVIELSNTCSYLSYMYEYFLKPIKTGKISTLIIYFGQEIPNKINTPDTIKEYFVQLDWEKIELLSSNEKANFILEHSRQIINSCAIKENWNIISFESIYEKIKNKNCLFREHFKKPILSPNKQFKAQIYFELDYNNNGTYIDFTDKLGNLLNRIQFTPSGYSVISKNVNHIEWVDSNCVKIWYIQVPALGIHAESNRKNYWLVKMDKKVEFRNVFADQNNPQALYQLGIHYYEGKHILKDKKKALELIRKAADLNYTHALKWLKRNNE